MLDVTLAGKVDAAATARAQMMASLKHEASLKASRTDVDAAVAALRAELDDLRTQLGQSRADTRALRNDLAVARAEAEGRVEAEATARADADVVLRRQTMKLEASLGVVMVRRRRHVYTASPRAAAVDAGRPGATRHVRTLRRLRASRGHGRGRTCRLSAGRRDVRGARGVR